MEIEGKSMGRRHSMVLAAAFACVSACSTSSDSASVSGASASASAPDPESSVPDRPEADPSPARGPADPAAKAEVRRKVRALLGANTAFVSTSTSFGEVYSIDEQARYSISPLRVDSRKTITTPESRLNVHYLSTESATWIRVEGGSEGMQDWACWVDVADIGRVGELPFPAEDLSGQPHVAAVLASYSKGVRASDSSEQVFEGTTDLATAAGLVSAKTLVSLGLDPQDTYRMPATLVVDDEHLRGIELELSQMATAAEAAGVVPDDGTSDSLVSAMKDVGGTIEVKFSDIGRSVTIEAPPADSIVTFSDPKDFETAMDACNEQAE